MATFNDLSNELLLEIITKVPFSPKDFLSISLTNKRLRNLLTFYRASIMKIVAREQFESFHRCFYKRSHQIQVSDLVKLKGYTEQARMIIEFCSLPVFIDYIRKDGDKEYLLKHLDIGLPLLFRLGASPDNSTAVRVIRSMQLNFVAPICAAIWIIEATYHFQISRLSIMDLMTLSLIVVQSFRHIKLVSLISTLHLRQDADIWEKITSMNNPLALADHSDDMDSMAQPTEHAINKLVERNQERMISNSSPGWVDVLTTIHGVIQWRTQGFRSAKEMYEKAVSYDDLYQRLEQFDWKTAS